MTLLAAYQVLLYRIGGQADFGVGVPSAGRDAPELEPLVGHFVNMLVMRADLAGAPSFVEVLRRVRDRALDAFEHRDAPFERLVAALAPDRDAVPPSAVRRVVRVVTPARGSAGGSRGSRSSRSSTWRSRARSSTSR